DFADCEVEQAQLCAGPALAEDAAVVALALAAFVLLARRIDGQQRDRAAIGQRHERFDLRLPCRQRDRLAPAQRQTIELRLAALGSIGQKVKRLAIGRPAWGAVVGGSGGDLARRRPIGPCEPDRALWVLIAPAKRSDDE